MRINNCIYIAAFCSFVRSSEFFHIFLCTLFFVRIFLEDDVSCACRSHNSDFSGRPSEYLVSALFTGAHSNVGAAVCFTENHGDLRNGSFAVSEQHLSAVTNYAGIFLLFAGQEAWYVDDVKNRNVEAVAETNETSCFIRCVVVKAACHECRLVSNDTNSLSVHTSEAGDDVLCEFLSYIVVFAVIYNGFNNIVHVIRSIGAFRHNGVESRIGSCGIITGFNDRSIFHVVGRQEGEQVTNLFNAVFVVFSCELSYTGSTVVGHCAAECFSCNLFTCYGFNNSRAGQEHLGCFLNHVNEVGQSRGVYSAACRWSHDCGNLRNNAGCNGVAPENLAVAGEGIDSFLNTSSAGIVQAYARCTDFQSQFIYVNDFSCMHFTKGAAFNGEVLSECKYKSSINSAVACYYTFTREIFLFLAEVVAAGFYKGINFYESAFIKQKSKSFTSSQFAFCMLFFNTFFATHSLYMSEVFMEKFNSFFNSCHSYTSKNFRVPRRGDELSGLTAHMPSFKLFLEGWAAGAFCQFKQKASCLWMQECNMTAACTNTELLVDERNFFSLQISQSSFDVIYTESNMLEAVLAAISFFNETSNRAVRSGGTQEFEFASFGLSGRFEEACGYMLFFNGFIRQRRFKSENVFHLLFNLCKIFNSYANMIDS